MLKQIEDILEPFLRNANARIDHWEANDSFLHVDERLKGVIRLFGVGVVVGLHMALLLDLELYLTLPSELLSVAKQVQQDLFQFVWVAEKHWRQVSVFQNLELHMWWLELSLNNPLNPCNEAIQAELLQLQLELSVVHAEQGVVHVVVDFALQVIGAGLLSLDNSLHLLKGGLRGFRNRQLREVVLY